MKYRIQIIDGTEKYIRFLNEDGGIGRSFELDEWNDIWRSWRQFQDESSCLDLNAIDDTNEKLDKIYEKLIQVHHLSKSMSEWAQMMKYTDNLCDIDFLDLFYNNIDPDAIDILLNAAEKNKTTMPELIASIIDNGIIALENFSSDNNE